MYRCEECGNIFEDGEQSIWKEEVGEFGGSPYFEEKNGCPLCKGSYEKIYECEICGSYNCKKHDDYCEQCEQEVIKKFKSFVENLTEKEKQVLLDLDIGDFI